MEQERKFLADQAPAGAPVAPGDERLGPWTSHGGGGLGLASSDCSEAMERTLGCVSLRVRAEGAVPCAVALRRGPALRSEESRAAVAASTPACSPRWGPLDHPPHTLPPHRLRWEFQVAGSRVQTGVQSGQEGDVSQPQPGSSPWALFCTRPLSSQHLKAPFKLQQPCQLGHSLNQQGQETMGPVWRGPPSPA